MGQGGDEYNQVCLNFLGSKIMKKTTKPELSMLLSIAAVEISLHIFCTRAVLVAFTNFDEKGAVLGQIQFAMHLFYAQIDLRK